VLGRIFESEIREQPDVWCRIAESDKAERFARAIGDRPVLLVGSGSSLFMGQLGALALRRRGIRAIALAATEAHFDHVAFRDACVIALSQSGRSSDLLAALDILTPSTLIALTNDVNSPLAARATHVIALDAGAENAVPASKSVTAMAAILLWGAARIAGNSTRSAQTLVQTATDVRDWLDGPGIDAIIAAAQRLARRRSVIIVGAGYGVPIANELALKLKEASYVHAEGFAAGEFRHGSSAVLDASCAIVGIVDDASRAFVERPLTAALEAEAARFVIGAATGDLLPLGAPTGVAFNTLAWLVAGQYLALAVGRARGVESDAPRGLSKVLL
jgi:glucosamine--fructose-6-phosphate aminotransferase (isomerizing)